MSLDQLNLSVDFKRLVRINEISFNDATIQPIYEQAKAKLPNGWYDIKRIFQIVENNDLIFQTSAIQKDIAIRKKIECLYYSQRKHTFTNTSLIIDILNAHIFEF